MGQGFSSIVAEAIRTPGFDAFKDTRSAAHFAREAGERNGRTIERIGADATDRLLHHGWPGNVRELRNVIERAVAAGVPVKILRDSRNPRDIGWRQNGVSLVVDSTGAFTDPTADGDSERGALRGHLEAGAVKTILSAPFKIKDQGQAMPEDAVTTVMGINDSDYDPRRHHVVSNASCTTTCLAHMMKPLLDAFGPNKILSASMATVHASTGSQAVLDRLPKSGKIDLRKSRPTSNCSFPCPHPGEG